MAEVCLTGCDGYSGLLLTDTFKSERGLHVVDSMVSTSDKGTVRVMLTNCSGQMQRVEADLEVGTAIIAELVDCPIDTDSESKAATTTRQTLDVSTEDDT